MKIALFGRSIQQESAESFSNFFKLCEEKNIQLDIFDPLYKALNEIHVSIPKHCSVYCKQDQLVGFDFVFSIGGDGTFLRTARLVGNSQIPIVGINTGRLGFLAETHATEISEVLEKLINGDFTTEDRSMLRIREAHCNTEEENYALNDISVLRRDTSSLIVTHVFTNGTLLNSFWADGLIISTPTGSTAYSMSAGGPIVVPGTNNLILTPIAPHSLTVRPIVIPDNTQLHIEIESRSSTFMLSVDSQSKIVDTTVHLDIEKADFPVKVVQLSAYNFYDTLRKKLMWGKDIRTSNR